MTYRIGGHVRLVAGPGKGNTQPSLFEMQRAWEREQAGQRMQQPTCASCGRRIVWVRMPKTGRLMPCDQQLEYGDGRKTLVTHDGGVIAKAGAHVVGRQPHFGTCPARKKTEQPTMRRIK